MNNLYNTNQYYLQDLQNMKDRIDYQIRQLQQMQQQPQPITQNFQLAPNTTNNELESKFVNNFDDVKNTFIMKLGIFVNKDFSNLWVKDVSGKIRTFNTVEVVEMDEKDKEIFNLKKQIEEMKGMINYEPSNADVDEPVTTKKSTRVSNVSKSNTK